MSDELVVSATDVHKRFGRLEVLKGVSLEVRKAETVCLIGPSGSGKTTFIRCINHLEKIDSGRIEVNGHLIGYRERNGKLVAGFVDAEDAMVFKLEDTAAHAEALALDGAHLFDPGGRGRPFKEWVVVPPAHAVRWPGLAQAALA